MLEKTEASETGRIEAFSDGVFAIALSFNALWRHASLNNRLLDRQANRNEIDDINARYRFGPALYLFAFLLSFVSVWLSVAVCFLLALFFAIRSK